MVFSPRLHLRFGLVAVGLVCATAGCPLDIPTHACTNHMLGPLVANAQAFKLEVYKGPHAHCVGNTVDRAAGAATLSRTYHKGEAIKLDVPPGTYALVLTTYSDTEGSLQTGSACIEQTLSPGGQLCFDVPVTESCVYRCGNTCCDPVNGTCDSTCALTCNDGFADCNHNPADGCEVNLATAGEKVCGGACINANTCCNDTDCIGGPTPAACYAGVCPAAGGTCSYAPKSTATICNGTTCCNSIGGTCKGDCSIMCVTPNADCNLNPADGCETDLNTSPDNCGQCQRACSGAGTDHVATPSCSAGTCNSSCAPGYANCKQPSAPTPDDGCECATPGCCPLGYCQVTHDNGFGGHYYDCQAQFVYNQTQATEAAQSYDITGSTITRYYNSGNDSLTAICNQNANSCPCWVFFGTGSLAAIVGHAYLKNDPPSMQNCFVPTTAANTPTWN